MYSIYNSGTSEKLINTVYKMHNKTTCNEKLCVSKCSKWYQWYVSNDRAVHYVINAILYITMLRKSMLKCMKIL